MSKPTLKNGLMPWKITSENHRLPPSGTLAVERRLSIWNFIFGLLSIVIAITVAILLRFAILTRHFLTLRQRVTRGSPCFCPSQSEL
jgi:hypothetical protein